MQYGNTVAEETLWLKQACITQWILLSDLLTNKNNYICTIWFIKIWHLKELRFKGKWALQETFDLFTNSRNIEVDFEVLLEHNIILFMSCTLL